MMNGFIGFLFIFGDTGENYSVEKNMKFSFFGGGSRLILGIASALIGLLKFFVPYESNVFILGDLLPALAGITGGFILIFGFYREHSVSDGDMFLSKENVIDRIGDTFLHYRKFFGFALAAVALLHFFFPGALFL